MFIVVCMLCVLIYVCPLSDAFSFSLAQVLALFLFFRFASSFGVYVYTCLRVPQSMYTHVSVYIMYTHVSVYISMPSLSRFLLFSCSRSCSVPVLLLRLLFHSAFSSVVVSLCLPSVADPRLSSFPTTLAYTYIHNA